MDITPATATVALGSQFDVAVRVIAGTNHVDSAEADLNFDPAILQVVSITPDAGMSGGGTTNFDNGTGVLNAALSSTAAFQTGTFVVMVVRFQAIALSAGTQIAFNTASPRISSAALLGVPYTGTFTSAIVEVVAATPTPSQTPTATPGVTLTPTRTPPTPCGPSIPCNTPLQCIPFATATALVQP